MLCFAARIASSMGGKMRSPLYSASKRLPSVMGGPSITPKVRWYCASRSAYSCRTCSSIFFSALPRLRTSTVAATVSRKVKATALRVRVLPVLFLWGLASGIAPASPLPLVRGVGRHRARVKVASANLRANPACPPAV
jgi:hypothetical protein